jgi:response regulator of citrate/malate metabolism
MNKSFITSVPERAVLIDDDPIVNIVNKTMLKKITPATEVLTFTSVDQALNMFKPDDKQTLILLDINMPVTNGWDFLEQYETFAGTTREKIELYFTSASANPEDMQRVRNSENVRDFLLKPISESTIREIVTHSK